MILGVGIDLFDTNRIESVYNKYPIKTLIKLLSQEEITIFKQLNNNINKQLSFLAKRFSVKESFLKALGIGLGRGICMNEISILNDEYGKPYIQCNNNTKKILSQKYNILYENIKFNISITDENKLVNTIVIISI